MSKSTESVPYRLKPGSFSSHGRILHFLRGVPRAVRILDVGASTGYLGAALKQSGFQRVCGIERDVACADEARPFYETMAVCDIEQGSPPWGDASFDVVICADVLEHVSEPWQVLRRLSRLVVPDGWVVISLPNIAHWSARLSLLFGRFHYTNSGLMDRGHLRFFTRRTARTLLTESGLSLCKETVTPLPIAHWCQGSVWAPFWRMVEFLDCCLAQFWPALCAYQFVFMSRPSAHGKPMIQESR